MKVLMVEGDLSTAEKESDYLRSEGFECDIATTAETGLKMARENKYSLVIIGAVLQGLDGFSVCREVRAETEIPIILLSGSSDDADKVRGFDAGADDYIVRSISRIELVARVKAHIGRYERLTGKRSDAGVLTIRGLRIDKGARRVYIEGEEISMPVKEYELLLFLAENPNIVFSKERLFDRIWGMDAMGDVATVTVHIQRIRDKIDRNQSEDKYIETVWGAGYRFL